MKQSESTLDCGSYPRGVRRRSCRRRPAPHGRDGAALSAVREG
jgi:hypothetical protein